MAWGFSAKIVRKLRTNPLVQTLLAPFGRDLAPTRWIFVVGCYNSGTSLLSAVLGSHPEIVTLPQEGAFLTDALPVPEQFRWTRMWCRCADSMRLDPGPASAARALRIKRQWSLWLPRNATNILEKSIANVVHIPFLAAHFRPANFIYLVRDGYAVAEGIRRKAKPWRWGQEDYPDGYPLELCAEQWRDSDDFARRYLAGIEHTSTVTYEAFTANPTAETNRILAVLGLSPLDPAVFARAWAIHDLEEPIRNMNEDSHRRLLPEELATIERVAGPALRRNGYQTPFIER